MFNLKSDDAMLYLQVEVFVSLILTVVFAVTTTTSGAIENNCSCVCSKEVCNG